MNDWLVDTLIATSGLMLLVLFIREPVRRLFGSSVAYGLWLIPAARVLMPTLTQTVEREVAPAATNAALNLGLSGLATPAQTVSAPLVTEVSLVDQLGGWVVILTALWMAGALALFASRMWAYRGERRRILNGAAELADTGRIRIVESASVNGPIAFGIIDRVIAVPASFSSHYSPDERRLALEHEFAHHHSGDLIANLFAFVLLSLQWFNPLAWASYAAFRFDQEAACDARVLDKAEAGDRASYGRAIAKAASGRALLFASALDRRKTLHRRLNSMLKEAPRGRRLAGQVIVIAAVALALPLTASKAIDYIDIPAPTAPVAPTTVVVPQVTVPQLPALAAAATLHHDDGINFNDGKLVINGQEKTWREMTPEERAEFEEGMAEMRQALQELASEKVNVRAEIEAAMAETKIDRAEMERDLAEAREDIQEAMRDIESQRADLIQHGVNVDELKASIHASMASIDDIDIDQIVADSMASIDVDAIEESLRQAEAEIRKSLADMEEFKRK